MLLLSFQGKPEEPKSQGEQQSTSQDMDDRHHLYHNDQEGFQYPEAREKTRNKAI